LRGAEADEEQYGGLRSPNPPFTPRPNHVIAKQRSRRSNPAIALSAAKESWIATPALQARIKEAVLFSKK
jgi:hypothetical protein